MVVEVVLLEEEEREVLGEVVRSVVGLCAFFVLVVVTVGESQKALLSIWVELGGRLEVSRPRGIFEVGFDWLVGVG